MFFFFFFHSPLIHFLHSADARVRLSRGSSELQTRQLQPTIGTPVEVPHPKIVIFMPVNFLLICAKITESPHAGKAVLGRSSACHVNEQGNVQPDDNQPHNPEYGLRRSGLLAYSPMTFFDEVKQDQRDNGQRKLHGERDLAPEDAFERVRAAA